IRCYRWIDWLKSKASFSLPGVERYDQAGTAFRRPFAIALIGEVVFQSGKKKRPEPSPLPSHLGQRIKAQEAREKTLRKVFRIGRAMAASAHIGIERRPIVTA